MQAVEQYQPEQVSTVAKPLPLSSRAGMGRRYDKAYLSSLADKLVSWYANNQSKPKEIRHILLERYLATLGHTMSDAEKFAKENTYFARSLELAKQWEKVMVIEHGLAESKGQTTVALVLKNQHGYKDTREQTVNENKTLKLIVNLPNKARLKKPVYVDAEVIEESVLTGKGEKVKSGKSANVSEGVPKPAISETLDSIDLNGDRPATRESEKAAVATE